MPSQSEYATFIADHIKKFFNGENNYVYTTEHPNRCGCGKHEPGKCNKEASFCNAM